MNDRRRPHGTLAQVAAMAALALLLSACGGGGGGGSAAPTPLPATITASNDAASVAWNSPATIDVASNDSVNEGTLRLESVGVPAHGQASVVQGKLLYTPAAGYFGIDSLNYTVRADNGGATASAQVTLEVIAQIQVSGTVSDGPVANAVVNVRVGNGAVSALADSQGRYVATLQSSRPDDVVVVDAVGVGAQSKVKLRSLVGEFGTLVSRASAQATLSASQLGTLDVSHFSTALAVLATQSNGGQQPASDAQLASASGRVKAQAWLDMATVLKRVIDAGVALPATFADTLALVSDQSAYDAFLAQTVAADPAAFGATHAATMNAVPLVAPAPVAVASSQTMVYFADDLSLGSLAYVVEFNPNGAAIVRGDFGFVPARWLRDDSKIELTFDTPARSTAYAPDIDPQTGQQPQVLVSRTGIVLRQPALVGSVAAVTVPTTWTYLDGSRSGQTVVQSAASDIGWVLKAIDLANRLPLLAGEFAVGRKWAGFIDPLRVDFSGQPLQDFVEISAAGQARSLDSEADYTFDLSDNVLRLTGPAMGTVVQHVRLSINSDTGEERWVAMPSASPLAMPLTATAGASSHAVVSVATLPMLARSQATRVWQSYRTWADQFRHHLYDDGAGLEVSTNSGVNTSMVATAWTLAPGGELVMSRRIGAGTSSARTRVRKWTPVSRGSEAGSVCVLESLTETFDADPSSPTIFFQRVLPLVDLGPAVR